ncbi:hypothetical protein P4S72_10675 [Vibrio sp. PP-XX7]
MKTNDSIPYLHHCRKVSREQMQAAKLVGRGMKFQFTGKDQHIGTLMLRYTQLRYTQLRYTQHTDKPLSQRWVALHTACGPLYIAQSSAESLLSVFSATPFAADTDPISPADDMPWFVELYNHHLYADFRQLLGKVEPASASTTGDPEISGDQYELSWQQGSDTGFAQIILPQTC